MDSGESRDDGGSRNDGGKLERRGEAGMTEGMLASLQGRMTLPTSGEVGNSFFLVHHPCKKLRDDSCLLLAPADLWAAAYSKQGSAVRQAVIRSK